MFNRIWVFILFTVIALSGASEFSTVLAQSEYAKLLGSDSLAGDGFGWSSDISGNVAIVGAWLDDDNGFASGTAYIYRFNGSNWIEEQKLVASDGDEYDEFGWSVAIEGNLAVVGANGYDDPNRWTGSVYVFRYEDPNWVQEAQLKADGVGYYWEEFGYSVDLSNDIIVVGASKANINGFKSGAVYVFRYDGSDWNQEAKLLASDGERLALFGIDVAIEDEILAIGASGDTPTTSAGSVYIYYYDDPNWMNSQKLEASDAMQSDHLGRSVDISGDALVATAYGVDAALPGNIYCNSGAAYIFRFNGSIWVEEAKLLSSDSKCQDLFGYSAAIDNDYVVIGAWQDDDNGYNSGLAYVFHYNSSEWVQQSTRLLPSDSGAQDKFGSYSYIGLSGDNTIIGSPQDDDKGSNSGSAYVFDIGVLSGDFEPDGDVDWKDFSKFYLAWLTGYGEPGWNAACDISDPNDGIINEQDIRILAQNWLYSVE